MQTVNLKNMTVIELKALAYDFIAAKELSEHNLKLVNQEISIRNTPETLKSVENIPPQ